MACQERYATLAEYLEFWCMDADPEQANAAIERGLRFTAARISASMAASGQCDCALADWAEKNLAFLNIVMTAVFHQCPCGDTQLSLEEKRAYMEWAQAELDAIRSGDIELCEGYTGREYPAWGYAEQNWDEGSAAQLIANSIARSNA